MKKKQQTKKGCSETHNCFAIRSRDNPFKSTKVLSRKSMGYRTRPAENASVTEESWWLVGEGMSVIEKKVDEC